MHSVNDEDTAGLFHNCGNFGDWLDDTGFVVSELDGDEGKARLAVMRGQCDFQGFEVDTTIAIHRNNDDIILGKPPARQHRRVLNGRDIELGHHQSAPPHAVIRCQREISRLCCAGGEGHLLGFDIYEIGNTPSRFFDHVACLATFRMDRGWIAGKVERCDNRIAGFAQERRGRVMVEIGPAAVHFFPALGQG